MTPDIATDSNGRPVVGLGDNPLNVAITGRLVTNNNTRYCWFDPDLLAEWAEQVAEVYEGEDDILLAFTPNAPMTALADHDAGHGVTIAPRVYPEDAPGGDDE